MTMLCGKTRWVSEVPNKWLAHDLDLLSYRGSEIRRNLSRQGLHSGIEELESLAIAEYSITDQ